MSDDLPINPVRTFSSHTYDLVIIHPGAAHGIMGNHPIYGDLGETLTAIEQPLWARLIAGYVRQKGFSVRIIDAEAEGLPPFQVAMTAWAYRPRLVCIAVYGHQPSASTQQMVAASATAKALKTICPAPIIMVGGHVSALPVQTMNEEQIDYACVGEGPVTIVGLLSKSTLGPGPVLKSNPDDVPGLVWRFPFGGEIRINQSAELVNIDELQGRAWDDLPMKKYRSHNWQVFGNLSRRQPYAAVYTSLGCPWRCHFCMINSIFESNRYRMRKPEDVVAEMQMLYRRYGVKTFKIIDEMFVLNEKHYTTIANGLIESGISDDINIWAYARVDTVREDRLALLRRAGIRWLALGIESGSKYVRDGASKRLKNDDIVNVVRSIQAADINVIGNYIFGLPDDTMESMAETLNLAMELNTEFANFYSAMSYPGSPLYDEAVREGWTLPETWRGYSQHNEDCRPLDTKHVHGAQVLLFRDEAFNLYFTNPKYLEMIEAKFGTETLEHVKQMTKYKLKRKLVDQYFEQNAQKPLFDDEKLDVATDFVTDTSFGGT